MNETAGACLGIIERAWDRVKRGHSPFLGTASSASKSKVRKKRKRPSKTGAEQRSISYETRQQVVQLLRQGTPKSAICELTCLRRGSVYWIEQTEGLARRAVFKPGVAA